MSSVAALSELNQLADQSSLAIGDRLRIFRGILDFLSGLGIDQAELFAIVRLAIAEFSQGFSLEGALRVIEAIWGAVDKAAAAGNVEAQAFDWTMLLQILRLIMELFASK